MSVRCPCGREYDATLFAFGRTLRCACGRRVGTAARLAPPPDDPGPPRFAADAMLGRLARWLRLLGLDTFYEAHVTDADLVRRALLEGRWILTRDRRLPDEWRVAGVHLVEAERPRAQLVEVARRFALVPWLRPFTRCAVCNAALAPLAPGDAEGRVPERIRARGGPLRACPDCDRAYWPGSHVARMQRVIASLAREAGDGGPPAEG
ncbi:MAG: Mut7-C RNAse domain-containing protein [Myxococcota bacterium]|nr:Mut7-C RNAse domain-containing protein [Myxococcota bacterium]